MGRRRKKRVLLLTARPPGPIIRDSLVMPDLCRIKRNMKTYMAKKGEITPTWHLVDITDKVLGRAAVRIASILMGKHRPEYTPSVDMGDFVIVINAENVKVTGGGKLQGRLWQRDRVLSSHLQDTGC